jgi:4-carboxymuconolactone decarboxylase
MSRRFRPLKPEELDAEQRRVHDAIAGGPRGAVRGPFNALLRSPALADQAQKLGEHVRFRSSLPDRLNELAILVTARYWKAQYEWYAHAKLADKAGLNLQVVLSIKEGKTPEQLQPDEKAVYEFAHELHHGKAVSDARFDAVKQLFGEKGVVDLIGVCGYYTLVSMILNVERVPLPEGEPDPLK